MANKILFLCTGNTCRSPVAEVAAREMFADLDLEFHSAGLEARQGQPASEGSVAHVRSRGGSLASHRSRRVSMDILEGTAWVIGMTRSHAAVFRSRFAGSYQGGIGILGAAGIDLMDRPHSPVVEEVDDPYGGPPEYYETVCHRLRELLVAWGPTFREAARKKEPES